jgi:hypothetical protein
MTRCHQVLRLPRVHALFSFQAHSRFDETLRLSWVCLTQGGSVVDAPRIPRSRESDMASLSPEGQYFSSSGGGSSWLQLWLGRHASAHRSRSTVQLSADPNVGGAELVERVVGSVDTC